LQDFGPKEEKEGYVNLVPSKGPKRSLNDDSGVLSFCFQQLVGCSRTLRQNGSNKWSSHRSRISLGIISQIPLNITLQSGTKLLAHHHFFDQIVDFIKHTLAFDGFTFPAPEHDEIDSPKVEPASEAQAQYPTTFEFPIPRPSCSQTRQKGSQTRPVKVHRG